MTSVDLIGGTLSILATVFAIQSLRQGRIPTHWPDPGIHKADDPGAFWFVVSVSVFVAVLGVLFFLLG